MPHVTVQSDTWTVFGHMSFFSQRQKEFGRALQNLVASALTCDEGRLESRDIEVVFTDVDRSNHLGYRDLEVVVVANEYDERMDNLDERREQIRVGLQKLIEEYDTKSRIKAWSVWVRPCPGSYWENRFS